MKESEIQRQILDYLEARGILAYRMNTGAMAAEYNGKQRFMRFGVAGMADILAFRVRERGVDDRGAWCLFTEIMPTWIEVKTTKGKQSKKQKSFQAQVEQHGHRYVLARSVEDVEGSL